MRSLVIADLALVALIALVAFGSAEAQLPAHVSGPAAARGKANITKRVSDSAVSPPADSPTVEPDGARHANQTADDRVVTRWTILLTSLLVLANFLMVVVAILQWRTLNAQKEAMIAQERALRDTIGKMGSIADSQSEDMQASITEAARAAGEMRKIADGVAVSAQAAEDSVKALRELTGTQSRAYLCVTVGSATYQERQKELKFGADPILINTGHTPARKVTYRAVSEVLPLPLPSDFKFPLPELTASSDMDLAPQQRIDLHAIVRDYVDERDVPGIKNLTLKRALYVWGTVNYEDVFGNKRFTNFCQILLWRPDNTVYGFYNHKHNNAD